MNYEILFKIN